jgi:autotransporter-associated beta strand protein
MKRRLSSIVLLLATVALCVEPVAPAEAALTRRYSFTADGSDSLGGSAWTANGGATFSGGQVHFDGVDDYLSLAANPLPNSGSNVTIEFWGTYDPATAVGSRVFDFSNGGGVFMYMTPRATPLTPEGHPSDPANTGSNTRWRWDDGFGVDIGPQAAMTGNTGQEVLFTLVLDGSTPTPLGNGEFRLYRDGALVATDSAEGITNILSGALAGSTSNRLGGGTSTPPGATIQDLPAFLTGSINEFRVYNHVLSTTDVLTNLISGPDVTSVSFTDKTWNGSASDWNTAGNWAAAGVPASTNRAVINGGTASVTAASPQVGTLTISNGTLSIGSGGSLDVKYPIQLNTGDTNSATINVTGGGVLSLGGILPDTQAGTKTINIDGGTIRPGFKSALVTSGAPDAVTPSTTTTVIGAGGATFDTPGTDSLTWQANLSGSGNLTKTGTGTLVLRPSNTGAGLADQNPNFSGEVFVEQGTLDVQQEHGVFGTAGSTGGGIVHLTDSTLVINTAYPLNFRKEFPGDIHATGNVLIDNRVNRVGTELRHEGSLSGDGTIEYIKPNLTDALGIDYQNRANPNVVNEPDVPTLFVDNQSFSGRLVYTGNWAVRIFATLTDPDMVPQSGDEVLHDTTDFPNAIVDLNHPGAFLGKRGNSPNQLIRLGGVAGIADPANLLWSRLTPTIAGSGQIDPGLPDFNDVTFQIGGANKNTDFAGRIEDVQGLDFVDRVAVEKIGTGSQSVGGPSTYSGTTTINGGAWLVNGQHSRNALELAGGPVAAANALGAGDYIVNSGGTLGGTGTIGSAADPVDVMVSGGTLAPGASVGTLTVEGGVSFNAASHFAVEISGATVDLLDANSLNITSGATLDILPVGSVTAGQYIIAQFDSRVGTFNLNAPAGFSVAYNATNITLTAPNVAGGVAGDYNGNGVVDAADYTFWRDRLGQNIALPNTNPADTDGMVTQAEYTFWKSRFGATAGSGSLALNAGAVPEPTSWALALLASVAAWGAYRRRQ